MSTQDEFELWVFSAKYQIKIIILIILLYTAAKYLAVNVAGTVVLFLFGAR